MFTYDDGSKPTSSDELIEGNLQKPLEEEIGNRVESAPRIHWSSNDE